MWRRVYQPPQTFVLPQFTWDEDRKLCERCEHCILEQTKLVDQSHIITMKCAVYKSPDNYQPMACISSRTDGPCGQDGTKFKPRGNKQ
jgi:hypothetical protein